MRRHSGLVIGILLLASGTALAQDKGDISGGYRYLRSEGESIKKGFYFDVTGHVTDTFSIVGEVGGSYLTESETFGGVTAEATGTIHTFAAGVKLRASKVSPNAVPFAQILFGGGKASVEAKVAGVTLIDESSSDPIMHLSGGVDVSGGGPVGVRVQVGWLRVFEDDASNIFTFSVGAKIGF
jgi:hypothetical protein